VTVVAAVDFGATSIRVGRVDLAADPITVDIVHRHHHKPVAHPDGSLRWDWRRLLAETERGLELALEQGPLASIGVDTWGVDYGLVAADGTLLGDPHCYRSSRTEAHREVVDRIGARRLYEVTGLQLQAFNTIFQVAAHDRDELAGAAHLLLLPDLVVHHLTGAVASERTTAGTSGLLDLRTRDWAPELLDACDARPELLPEVVEPGTVAGVWRGIPVVRVGGHDTASAVVGMGAAADAATAFVATGTWLLVGREQPEADTSEAARQDNFTNEQGVDGGIRFLKNLAGFWLLEECRRAWGEPEVAPLLAAAAAVEGDVDTFDVTDPRFLAPADMEAEVRDAAGLPASTERAVVARAIVASLAATTADVVGRLGGIREIAMFGGGAGVELLRTEIAARTGLPVSVGPTEAAALGNALVQGVALGHFTDLAAARAGLATARA